MSVEVLSASIGNAAASAAKGIESTAIRGPSTPLRIFDASQAGFSSMREILKSPQHTINSASLNPDRILPPGVDSRIIFNQKLFRAPTPVAIKELPKNTSGVGYLVPSGVEGDSPEVSYVGKSVVELIAQKTAIIDWLTPQLPNDKPDRESDQELALKTKIAIETSPMPQEQKELWTKKFEAALAEKYGPPTTGQVPSADTEPEEEAEKKEVEEPKWEVRIEKNRWQVAKDTLEKRLAKAALLMSLASVRKSENPQAEAVANLPALDIPDVSDAAKIGAKALEFPKIKEDAQRQVGQLVEPANLPAIHKTINRVIWENKPKEKKEEMQLEKVVEESKLPKAPQKLAKKGAHHIALKGIIRIWRAVKHQTRSEPVELDKIKSI